MAYYNQNQAPDSSLGMNKKEDEQEQTAPATLSSNAAGPTAAPLSGNPVGQNMSAPASAKAASSGMGGSFQSYQKANQGTATNRLNEAANRNVANQGKAANTGITQATNQFNNKVESGTLANRYNAVSDVANTVNAARKTVAAPLAPTANTSAPQAAPAAAPVLPQVEGVDRFKEVINAKYQGPSSLRQAGLYEIASGKVENAQNTIGQAKTAAGREEMLANLYAKRGDYTRGQNKLDASLLNSSQAGVNALQDTAKAQGNLDQKLDKAQINSSNTAQNRSNEIGTIREEARNTFTQGKKAEEAATDKRLDDMLVTPVNGPDGKPMLKADGTPLTQWDQLPEAFKSVIRNKKADNAAQHVEDLKAVRVSPEYKLAQKNLQAAQNIPKRLQITKPGGGTFSIPNPEYETGVKAAQAKLNDLESYNEKAVNFNQMEANLLGVGSGEGLYKLGEKAIKTANADREKLVSRDEQARQAVLSQLAGLDLSDRLDTNLKFSNADKAGTQSVLDSYDAEATRKGLNEAEEGFQKFADRNITGTGVKKNKTSGKRYYANETANLKDLLKKSGYDFEKEASNQLGNEDLLKKIAGNTSGFTTQDPSGAAGAVGGMVDPIKNMGDGQSVGSNYLDLMGSTGLNAITGALGLGSLGNAVGGMFGGGSTAGESKSDAKRMAREDLQRRVTSTLDNAGFENRVGVQNNDTVNTRMEALKAMLAGLDKTNT